jgi:hypothetical protein
MMMQCCGSGPLDPDPGSASGMNNPGSYFRELRTIFWVKILKFFDTCPGILDGKNSDPVQTSRIRNTATMYDTYGLSKLRGGQGFFLVTPL